MSRVEEYIKVRKNQLQEDMKKAHDDHDVAWYNRLIQELDWVHQMESKPTRNCYMEGKRMEIKYTLNQLVHFAT